MLLVNPKAIGLTHSIETWEQNKSKRYEFQQKKKANEFSGQYKAIPEQQLCQTSRGFCLHWGNRLEAPGKISRERKQRTDQYPDTSKCKEKKFTFLFF